MTHASFTSKGRTYSHTTGTEWVDDQGVKFSESILSVLPEFPKDTSTSAGSERKIQTLWRDPETGLQIEVWVDPVTMEVLGPTKLDAESQAIVDRIKADQAAADAAKSTGGGDTGVSASISAAGALQRQREADAAAAAEAERQRAFNAEQAARERMFEGGQAAVDRGFTQARFEASQIQDQAQFEASLSQRETEFTSRLQHEQSQLQSQLQVQMAGITEDMRQFDQRLALDQANLNFLRERLAVEEAAGRRDAAIRTAQLAETIEARRDRMLLARQQLVQEARTAQASFQMQANLANQRAQTEAAEINEARRQFNIEAQRRTLSDIANLISSPGEVGKVAALLRGGTESVEQFINRGGTAVGDESLSLLAGMLGQKQELEKGPDIFNPSLIGAPTLDIPTLDLSSVGSVRPDFFTQFGLDVGPGGVTVGPGGTGTGVGVDANGNPLAAADGTPQNTTSDIAQSIIDTTAQNVAAGAPLPSPISMVNGVPTVTTFSMDQNGQIVATQTPLSQFVGSQVGAGQGLMTPDGFIPQDQVAQYQQTQQALAQQYQQQLQAQDPNVAAQSQTPVPTRSAPAQTTTTQVAQPSPSPASTPPSDSATAAPSQPTAPTPIDRSKLTTDQLMSVIRAGFTNINDPTDDQLASLLGIPGAAEGGTFGPGQPVLVGEGGKPEIAVVDAQGNLTVVPLAGQAQTGGFFENLLGGSPSVGIDVASQFLRQAQADTLQRAGVNRVQSPLDVAAPGTSGFLRTLAAATASTGAGIPTDVFFERIAQLQPRGLDLRGVMRRTA